MPFARPSAAVLSCALVLSASPLLAVSAQATTVSPPGTLEFIRPATVLPATVLDAVGDAGTQAFRVQRSPVDVEISVVTRGSNRRFAHDGVVGHLHVAGDNVTIPFTRTGGTEPDAVVLFHGADGSQEDVALSAGDRSLTAAGSGVLIATPSATGWTLLVRTAGPVDQVVGQLPAGSFGAVASDVTGVLLAFTPTGASGPDLDYIDLAAATVTTMSSAPLVGGAPHVALSDHVLAWTDGADLVRVARTGGPETRRALGGVPTALAVLDDSSAWISAGRLDTAPSDPAAGPLDHGPVLVPEALFATKQVYQTVTGANTARTSTFDATQVGELNGTLDFGSMLARVVDLRLSANLLARHDTSNPEGTLTVFSRSGTALSSPVASGYGNAAGGRRLWGVSGRFRALGNATDTAVTVSTSAYWASIDPSLDLTVAVAPGVDTIELSGSRLLVHRPGQGQSQLYTVGSNTVSSYPLDAQIGGTTVAWQEPDGSVHAQDLSVGAAAVLLRQAGAPTTCATCGSPVAATLQVAGDLVFWSWYGENRVAALSGAPTITLPDGDLTRSRLSSRVLASVDPTTSLLSVTDLRDPSLKTSPIADAPVAFDVDDQLVAWSDRGYTVRLAVLPVPAAPAARVNWSQTYQTTVVPVTLTTGTVAQRWRHRVDYTQPVDPLLTVRDSAGTVVYSNFFGSFDGSFDVTWDGQLNPTNPDAPLNYAAPGRYSWTIEAHDRISGQVLSTETGTMTVQDIRQVSIPIISRPTTLVYGTSGMLSARVLIGNAGVRPTGVPGAVVRLQSRLHGTTAWRTLATRTTAAGASAGSVQFALSPVVFTDYRLWVPSAVYGPQGALTSPLLTNVSPKVAAVLSVSRVRAGATVAVTGTVAPRHAGQTVSLQRLVSGTWRTVSTVRLTSSSGYRFTFRAPRGSSALRILKPADSDHAVATSATLGLRAS